MSSYTVKQEHGCTLVYGSLPAQEMVALIEKQDKNACLDADLAQKIGATLVMGTPESLEKLKRNPAIKAIITSGVEALVNNYPISSEAKQWLEKGERGLSSCAIFYAMTELPGLTDEPDAHPRDPSDLRRCRLLLEQVPEFARRLDEMKSVSLAWLLLVDQWHHLCSLMDEESPEWRKGKGSAPKTYEAMNSILANI